MHMFAGSMKKLLDEVRKDLWFFGLCGAAVAVFLAWQPRIKALGMSNDPQWANDLLADFMSFNAFAFVLFGYLIVACAATLFGAIFRPWPRLERMVEHVEARMIQLASSIIAFMIGLSAVVALYSFMNLDAGGLKVLLVGTIFNALIVAAFVMASAVAKRTEPFDRWWAALLMLLLTIAVVIWLALFSSGKTG